MGGRFGFAFGLDGCPSLFVARGWRYFFFTSLYISVLMKEMEEIVTLVGGMGLENGEIGTDNDYEIFFFASDGLRSRKDST